MSVGQPKMGGSWWRDLTECGPLEKGVENHFSILALSKQGKITLKALEENIGRTHFDRNGSKLFLDPLLE